jgi:hypothetical protein
VNGIEKAGSCDTTTEGVVCAQVLVWEGSRVSRILVPLIEPYWEGHAVACFPAQHLLRCRCLGELMRFLTSGIIPRDHPCMRLQISTHLQGPWLRYSTDACTHSLDKDCNITPFWLRDSLQVFGREQIGVMYYLMRRVTSGISMAIEKIEVLPGQQSDTYQLRIVGRHSFYFPPAIR